MTNYQKTILVLLSCKFLLAFAQFCEIGWSVIGTNCYKFTSANENGTTWFDAQKACESSGSNLVSIQNMDEQTQVSDLIEATLTSFVPDFVDVWIGLNRTEPHNATWQWIDGTPFNFSYWDTGTNQPDDWNATSAEGEACTTMRVSPMNPDNFKWNDLCCMCQKFSFLSNETGHPVEKGGYVCKKRKQRTNSEG